MRFDTEINEQTRALEKLLAKLTHDPMSLAWTQRCAGNQINARGQKRGTVPFQRGSERTDSIVRTFLCPFILPECSSKSQFNLQIVDFQILDPRLVRTRRLLVRDRPHLKNHPVARALDTRNSLA
jgi:hypothetical protein